MPGRPWSAAIVLTLAASAPPVQAQLFQGTVRDSATRSPVPGVVVSVIDSSGQPGARTLTTMNGGYRIVVPSTAARLRVQRIGYRMREVPIRPSADETASVDLVISPVPSLLEPVHVVSAAACPRRRDNARAQALYEQARAGLLATIVARESNPADVVRYLFDRPFTSWPDTALVEVHIDSTKESTISFKALFTGAEFVKYGFLRKVGSHWQYLGPDADVLLDDGFANGYCFSIADRDRSRRSQIGLSFAAATKEKGRVDIQGTLWIDTVSRSLSTIEFRYTGVGGLAGYLNTGGRTSFREMANGVVAVTDWSVRLVDASVDTVQDRSGNPKEVHGLVEKESGGYLAKASWPDGTRWIAPMGTARFRLMVNDSTPLVASGVYLANTDYHGVTDSTGAVVFSDLYPGRYQLVVGDTLLQELGWEPDPQLEFIADPGKPIDAKARVQTTAEQLMKRCANRASRTDLVAVVNVKDASEGAPGVKVDFTVAKHAAPLSLSQTTGPQGNIVLCFDRDAIGATIQMSGSRGDMRTQTITHILNRRVTLFRLQLAKAAPGDTVSVRAKGWR
jgi:hypothetical protein